ncbi:MAG: hypothetical protein WC686_02775 [Candidatus Shapirobacteria bacterium]|jgi:hypothetical protein
MRKIKQGITFGVLAGLVDLVPMIIQGLTWDANLSAFLLWVVSGFLIASSNLPLKGPVKGVVISFLVLIPSAILIGWQEPISLVPIFIVTLILGSGLGYCIDKFGK